MGNIDRADWHYGGNYPVHRQLGSKSLEKYGGDTLQRVGTRQATGRDLLFTELDEKFFPELLTKEVLPGITTTKSPRCSTNACRPGGAHGQA
jgi:hypothetical protein